MSETNVKQSSYGTAKCFYLKPICNGEYQVIICDNNMNRVPTHKMFGYVLKSDSYYNDDTDRVCTDLAKSGIFHYRTEKEIEVLKEAWKADPIFDIENEWGFKHYYKELFLYRKTIEAAWRAKRIEKETREAKKLGLSLDEYQNYLIYSNSENNETREAEKLLVNYIGQAVDLDSDMRTEIECIAKHIVDASVNATKAALLKDTGKKRLHRKRLIEKHWIYRYSVGLFLSRFKNNK